jgi:hypothetical protein
VWSRRAIAAVAIAVLGAAGCSSHSGLPIAKSEDFVDLDLIAQHAHDFAKANGDPNPGIAIVRSTPNAVWGHGEGTDPNGYRDMYFVRMDGNFNGACAFLHGGPGGGRPLKPSRWLFFSWDPRQHGVADVGCGSAPHLEEFGQVYAVP